MHPSLEASPCRSAQRTRLVLYSFADPSFLLNSADSSTSSITPPILDLSSTACSPKLPPALPLLDRHCPQRSRHRRTTTTITPHHTLHTTRRATARRRHRTDHWHLLGLPPALGRPLRSESCATQHAAFTLHRSASPFVSQLPTAHPSLLHLIGAFLASCKRLGGHRRYTCTVP